MKDCTSGDQLRRIVLKGYKSIAECDLKLGVLNVLVGCNGAGKSNFIEFFQMIQSMLEGRLQRFVGYQGGPDAILHFGRKRTEELATELYFGNNGYLATFQPTQDNRLMFTDESVWWNVTGPRSIGNGYFETQALQGTRTGIDQYILPTMQQWRVYHFHDTSDTAHVKQLHSIHDNRYLRPDARNLAAFLYYLQNQHGGSYQKIMKTIQLVAPFFGGFLLRPSLHDGDKIELLWQEKEQDIPCKAHQLSDGTLRFIALTTLFLQPEEQMPETILVDEPELGLHPYAITLLAALMRSVSTHKQLIVSTQSVELLNEFDPEDIIVADRHGGRSLLRRLEPDELSQWLEEYSLGELWKKNIFGGRPAR